MKPTLENYPDWYIENFDINLMSKSPSIYTYVIQKLQRDVENSDFWKQLNGEMKNFTDEYYLIHGYPLLKIESVPLFAKTYDSVINKTFRKNIVLNDNFPEPPPNGWIKPDNWFEKISDLLRTSITVRYLDGVEFLANKIKQLCINNDYEFIVDYEAREEGYYAAHITIKGKFIIIDEDWNSKEIIFPIEIQITTQLQEVIKALLHKMYEEVRVLPTTNNNQKWQWDYKSLEFSSNYLGHILHYVEGMILEVRDKQKNN
jgi:ppGpp synthetase/RelA/SpoT-type nucleotidyltranferase